MSLSVTEISKVTPPTTAHTHSPIEVDRLRIAEKLNPTKLAKLYARPIHVSEHFAFETFVVAQRVRDVYSPALQAAGMRTSMIPEALTMIVLMEMYLREEERGIQDEGRVNG